MTFVVGDRKQTKTVAVHVVIIIAIITLKVKKKNFKKWSSFDMQTQKPQFSQRNVIKAEIAWHNYAWRHEGNMPSYSELGPLLW